MKAVITIGNLLGLILTVALMIAVVMLLVPDEYYHRAYGWSKNVVHGLIYVIAFTTVNLRKTKG